MSALERHRKTWPGKSDEWLFERLDNELRDKVEEIHLLLKQIERLDVEQNKENRFDSEAFSPPFRLGKKQKRAVVDSNGVLVILMPHKNEKQAQMYCDYLNGLI